MALRDVVDYLDYDVDPRIWIESLLNRIGDGTYEPRAPERFSLAKSNGFSRRMALPQIPDLVLYRCIVDTLYKKARKQEHRHVYFEQEDLTKIQKEIEAEEQALKSVGTDAFWSALMQSVTEYDPTNTKRYRAWLGYNQYRRMLIFKKIYPFIVTTDIANFFDSVLYSKVADALHDTASPPGLVNLLFLLLERLSFRGELSEGCRLGLPVDEFDCSRKLAHLVLYPHDDRMVAWLGEEAYVRWMDDQNYGVASRADGLRALAEAGRSLAKLHLTPNSSKSRVLTIAEARRHFHLDLNETLDRLEKLPHKTVKQRKQLGKAVRELWRKAIKHQGKGEWSKVLKRIYLCAGRARARFLRKAAQRHVLENPQIVTRVCDYLRCSGSTAEYVKFVQRTWLSPEQVYEDVNLILCESLLRLEPDANDKRILSEVAAALLKRTLKFPGSLVCAGVAPLLILRFSDRRSLTSLKSTFTTRKAFFPARVSRAAAIVYASYGRRRFEEVREVAATLESNNLSEAVRLLERVLKYNEVPRYYSSRFDVRYDAMRQVSFVDVRTLVSLRLLRLNDSKHVQSWIRTRTKKWRSQGITQFDRDLLRRTVETLKRS